MSYKWKDQTGKVWDVGDMTTSHIKNCIKYCEHLNKEGILVGSLDPFGNNHYAEIEYDFFISDIEEFEKELKRRIKSYSQ